MPAPLLYLILDGCRPDALQSAHAPHLRALWEAGASTFTARSVMPSITLPCHNSMFRGVSPDRHGVGADNIFRQSALAFPSVLDLAANHGRHCAMFYSWEQLRDLSAPGSLKLSHCRAADYGADNDAPVAESCAAYLTAERPDFCVLYLGDIDITGHLYGWMSREYLHAVELNDQAVGTVLRALEQAGLREQTTFLVQADHGGHDTDHGTDSPEDLLIPWFVSGPGICAGHAIQAPVSLLDTAPTIARLLDLPIPDVWEGRPVEEVFA